MRLTNLLIHGYQGVIHLDLDIEKPVVLIAGENATGKTTLRDAIQFAITGESSRVRLKKEYPQLVRVGSNPKESEVSVTVGGFTYQRNVASGKGKGGAADYPAVLPHLLGSTHFARLDRKEQADLLFAVTGVKRDPATVKRLLEERHVDQACLDLMLPMLRRGFAAGAKFCKERQSEMRGAWEAITQERFGEAKAPNWQAPPPPATEPLEELVEARENLSNSIPEQEKAIAALETEKDSMVQHTHSSGVKYECPSCQAELIIQQGKLVLDERNDEPEPSMDVQQKLIMEINGLRRDLAETQSSIASINLQISQAENAEQIQQEATTRAAEYFANYGHWKQLADALAPTGIPLQILEAGLKPINERLAQTSDATGWKQIVIGPDLGVSYGGICYGLCSESERWRINAAIVEAMSLLSGTKLFILDRFDVLHPTERSKLLGWILKVAPEHDSIIIMATLKNEPTGMPDAIQTVWLNEGGERKVA